MTAEVLDEDQMESSPPLSLCDEISALYDIINQPYPSYKGLPKPQHVEAYYAWAGSVAKARVALLKRVPDIIQALCDCERG